MSEPLTHIQRSPLPWRDSHLTECGRPVAEFADVIDLDEAKRRAKQMGKQRFVIMHCMTCTNTVQRWPTWDDDPLARLIREGRGSGEQITKELRAIAALIEAHREDFDEYVTGLGDTVSLADRRARPRYVDRLWNS